MTVLAPLAARYATWLDLPASATADTTDEDPALVRAMPVILRIERAAPARSSLLEAAAAAAVAVCLDPQAEPGGPWHSDVDAWVRGRIRKVSRRARGAQWGAVQDLPGVTVSVAGAEARALVPWLVSQVPREVAKLQISGSDLPVDDPGPVPVDVPVLWCNPLVPMTAGKAAAQVGHATMLLAALLNETELRAWAVRGFRCAVRTPTKQAWPGLIASVGPRMAAVRDAGFTEVPPGTITVLAQAPAWS